MQRQDAAREDFKLRNGGSRKLRVWQWTEDPRITIRERVNASGGLGFRVTIPKRVTGGRVLFVQSRDFDTAKGIARTKGQDFRESRSTALVLGDANKIQAATAVRELARNQINAGIDEVARVHCEATSLLKPFGVTLQEGAKVLADALAAARKTGKPLLNVVGFAVNRLCPAGGSRTLAQVAQEMIEVKRGWHARGDLRDASFRDFNDRAGKIADEIGSFPLPDVTKTLLYDWLKGLDLARRSKKNYRMVLAELLRYSTQKRYIESNPLMEFTRQDIKEIEGANRENKQPAILTPANAEKLLKSAFEKPDLDLGGAVVLGLFGGIRTEELKRLSWDAVRLNEEHPFVVIGPEIAKKRRIRNVPLPACAVAWLRQWERADKKALSRSAHANDFQKRFMKLCVAAKINWEANAMRHSFGSYHYALHGNSVETARIMGHKTDDSVLFSHYRALTTKAEGEAFFAIYPKTEGKVIAFPGAASQ